MAEKCNTNTTVSRGPFDIRLDLLRLAWDIKIKQCEANGNKYAMDKGGDLSRVANLRTESPTTEEVIAEAAKLNGFISAPVSK